MRYFIITLILFSGVNFSLSSNQNEPVTELPKYVLSCIPLSRIEYDTNKSIEYDPDVAKKSIVVFNKFKKYLSIDEVLYDMETEKEIEFFFKADQYNHAKLNKYTLELKIQLIKKNQVIIETMYDCEFAEKQL